METFYIICQWLLILAFIGFFASIAWIVITVLRVKSLLVADAKRLYEPPMRSGKSIAATAKGVFLQEKARVQRMGVVLKGTTASVKDAASDVQVVAKSIHASDLKPITADFKAVVGVLGHIATFLKAVSQQRAQTR